MKIEDKITLYLNEGRSQSVSFEFAADFINKKCQAAVKGTPIYRGNRKIEDDFYHIIPSKFDARISPYADTNFYNLLFSNLPSWKRYPKRNKSIVCSTDYDEARNRNNHFCPYRVFPVDGSKIGVCPDWDIWDSFQDALDGNDLADFNYVLEAFLENVLPSGILWGQRADIDYSIFVKQCKMIDKNKKDTSIDDIYDIERRPWLDAWFESDKPFLSYLSELLSPDKNGFKLVKSGASLPTYREVWTDGECIMVLDDKVPGLIEKNR